MTTTEDKKIELTYWQNQEQPKEGELYTDPKFPPNENSLMGKDSNGNPIDNEAYTNANEKYINPTKIEFLRASEIFKNSRYVLISDKMDMSDIVPGELDDSYFLVSVQNLCKVPANINKIFKTKIMNPDGFYELILNIDGKPQIVIVDDYLPVDKDTKQLIYAKSTKNEIWISLLEKAWAKVNGGYANIIGGTPMEALEFLTGFNSLSFDTENKDDEDLNEYKIEIVKHLQAADKNASIISCSTTSKEKVDSVGLINGYTYNMLDFYHVEKSDGNKEYLFKLRNPWSKGEWNGDWSDKSSLWDDKTKSQVNFTDKEDGIFFMNDNDFFKYFTHVEICYVLYDATSVTYSIEGEEKNKNGIVFNIITEKEGFLSVSVQRKNWRIYREVKNKLLPTHISVVKYDPNAENRLKTFSDYNGTFGSYRTCTLNVPVEKGNYLIYIYRDLDHAEYTPDDILNIKILCSSAFKHAQMSYDERDLGFPLLQNIILQAEFYENNYDPDKAEGFDINSNQIRGNGIGHVIYYITTPGYFLSFTGSTKKVKNYIMLTPYLDEKTTTFTKIIASGKYLVLLGLLTKTSEAYAFKCFSKAYTTNRTIKEIYENNDIDLKLYTDINNDIKNQNVKEKKIQSLENCKKERYYDVGNETTEKKSLDELKKEYGDYIKFLEDVPGNEEDSNLEWVVIKGEYVIYVGQVNKNGIREGKGLLINPMNVFAGVFKNDLPNGKGYSYNANKEKLYYDTYVNGRCKGNKVTPEEEAKMKEEEEEKKRQEELERLKKEEEERRKEQERIQEELRKAEEERRKEEERIQEELRKAEEERRAAERLAEELRKQEEEAKKEEEEKKIQQAKEEAAKKEEELKKQQEEAKKAAEKKAQKLKEQEEKAKQESQKVEDNISNVKDKIFAAAKELKKKSAQTKSTTGTKTTSYVPSSSKTTKSTKRRQEIIFPIEEVISICISCGCNIF